MPNISETYFCKHKTLPHTEVCPKKSEFKKQGQQRYDSGICLKTRKENDWQQKGAKATSEPAKLSSSATNVCRVSCLQQGFSMTLFFSSLSAPAAVESNSKRPPTLLFLPLL